MRREIFSTNKIDIPNIISMGYSGKPHITRFGPATRRFYIIHYVVSGKGFFNGHPVTTSEGFVITPNMFEEYYPDKKDPWKFLWIISDDIRITSFIKSFDLNKHTNIFKYNYPDVIKSIGEEIEKETTLYDTFLVLQKFLTIYKTHLENNPISSEITATDMYFDTAVNFIKINIPHQIKVNDLTEFLGITQPYLYKIFKAKCNLSPKEYIINYQVDQAKKMLRDTNLTITQIGMSVGFSDVLQFSKFFRMHTNMSPNTYRNNINA
ncbi:MAG: AraC family transcriptional regulator [Clostridia bacterium]|nr:AraC family transcriptional regulator [Clostridia bacterium]